MRIPIPEIPWEYLYFRTGQEFSVEDTRNVFLIVLEQLKKDYKKLEYLRFKKKTFPEQYKGLTGLVLHDMSKLIWGTLDHLSRLKEYKKETFYGPLQRDSANSWRRISMYLLINLLEKEGVWIEEEEVE